MLSLFLSSLNLHLIYFFNPLGFSFSASHPIMVLFQVDGWKLKDKVAVGGPIGKKSKRKQRKENNETRKEKENQTKDHQSDDTEDHQNDDKEDYKNNQSDDIPKESEVKKVKPDSKKLKKGTDKVKDLKKKASESKTKETESIVTPELTTQTKLTPLQQKMMAKLSGSRFRWINEQLYTTTSDKALEMITKQPALFDEYHQGFRSQVQSWPENPVDVFVKTIKERGTTKQVNAPGGLPGVGPNKQVVIADMGCGEAQLALDVNKVVEKFNKNPPKGRNLPRKLDIKVHSFDLKKHNDRITVADIKNVPLPDESCSVVVFCLALMGTNFLDFIAEAQRILAPRGELWIAEIKSRFSESSGSAKAAQLNDVGAEFVNAVKLSGFFHKSTDNSNKMFTRFEFYKPLNEVLTEKHERLLKKRKFIENESELEELQSKREKIAEGQWLLKPCIYKRR